MIKCDQSSKSIGRVKIEVWNGNRVQEDIFFKKSCVASKPDNLYALHAHLIIVIIIIIIIIIIILCGKQAR